MAGVLHIQPADAHPRHGAKSTLALWQEALRLYKYYVQVCYTLMDYLTKQAALSSKTGLLIMRSMLIAFPYQKALASIDDQYILGTDLLVAPVLNEQDGRSITFPKGVWKNFRTGAIVKGGIT